MKKLAKVKKEEAFTIIESFIILIILIVLSMVLVALYLHHSGQTGDKEATAVISNFSKILC
jgi:competence protein ComGC